MATACPTEWHRQILGAPGSGKTSLLKVVSGLASSKELTGKVGRCTFTSSRWRRCTNLGVPVPFEFQVLWNLDWKHSRFKNVFLVLIAAFGRLGRWHSDASLAGYLQRRRPCGWGRQGHQSGEDGGPGGPPHAPTHRARDPCVRGAVSSCGMFKFKASILRLGWDTSAPLPVTCVHVALIPT